MMSEDSSQINEVHSDDNHIFDNVNHQLAQEMHQEEHLGFDDEYDFLTNTIPYKKLSLVSDAENVSTKASVATSDQIAMIAILNNLTSQVVGHAKTNQEITLRVCIPTAVEWRTNASKDGMPASGTSSVEAVRVLDTHRTPIQKQPEALLCLVEMDLFSLTPAPNPTKVKTRSRPHAPHELPLLTLTSPRVIEMDEPAAATDSSGVPADVNNPDPLAFADTLSPPPADVAQSSQGIAVAEDPGSENASSPIEWVAAPQEQVNGEEKLKAVFEEFKRYEDDRVEQRCAELDARLDALSIDFDEERYPHMLTAIARCRWVIVHGLRLAMMKCAESLEMRQAFADVVSARVAKGMSEGLKHGVKHGRGQLELESIEAYDLEAEAKFVAALQSLKDLKFSLLDQLESLKDAPMDVIMAALYLESDTRGMLHNIYAISAPAPLS
nr:transposase (putative), gypsy type [Tanacetum cinerariifolium]